MMMVHSFVILNYTNGLKRMVVSVKLVSGLAVLLKMSVRHGLLCVIE